MHTLEDSNLEAIREAVGLESKLQTLMGGRAEEGVDWAILERLTPLLHLWVSNQLSLLHSWYARIFATETWQPVSQPRGCSRYRLLTSCITSPARCLASNPSARGSAETAPPLLKWPPRNGTWFCRSAVELVKIVRETLEALFDLHLGLPDEVVTAAGAGLDEFLQRCVSPSSAQQWLTLLAPPAQHSPGRCSSLLPALDLRRDCGRAVAKSGLSGTGRIADGSSGDQLLGCASAPHERVWRCRYAQQTAAEVGSPEFMIPPVPALTRYKKEVAIKAAAADVGSAPSTPPR